MKRLILLALCLAACGTSGDMPGPDSGIAMPAPDAAAMDATNDAATDAANDAMPPDDDLAFRTKRQACNFKAGDKADVTFGPSIAKENIPIDTIVIVSQENRSFDEYFSKLANVDAPSPNVMLVDSMNAPHARFHQTDYCFGDTKHDWDSMHLDWNMGKNDGFVKQNDPNGVRTLGWFDETDIDFYYALASTYGVSDSYYSGLLGPTGPNRLYLYAATSSGHVKNGPGVAQGHTDIFKELTKAKVSFGVYSAATQDATNCTGPYSFETSMFCGSIPGGSKPLSQYMADAAAGKLPAVSWIYPGSDEHPSADMQVGESNVQSVYDALAKSPQWPHAMFVLVYDEGGGAYDHAPPPSACPPDAIQPLVPQEASIKAAFDRYGFRVPLVVASPYSKPGYVSHVTNSHTSILRFLELRFGLPAMSDRDANAEPLLDFFDFTKMSFQTPKIPPKVVIAPPASKGC